jgi:hypothetical protein
MPKTADSEDRAQKWTREKIVEHMRKSGVSSEKADRMAGEKLRQAERQRKEKGER